MNRDEIIGGIFRLGRTLKRRPQTQEHRHSRAVERLMHVIAEHDGISPRELCEIMDVRPSSMSETLSRMEEKKLIERKTCANDKRMVKVFLTDNGKEDLAYAHKLRSLETIEITSCFSDEEAQLFIDLCNKLANHLDSLNSGNEFDI